MQSANRRKRNEIFPKEWSFLSILWLICAILRIFNQIGGIMGILAKYTISITELRVIIAVIWCMLAFYFGTKFSKVTIPLAAW